MDDVNIFIKETQADSDEVFINKVYLKYLNREDIEIYNEALKLRKNRIISTNSE